MSANDELQAHTCEKMLQEYGNVANNVAQGNSQDLTEKWKKGELEIGMYYIKYKGSEKLDWWHGYYWEDSWSEDIEEVIAPVPSYEEWQELIDKKYWCNARAKNLLEKNQQLKTLLKEWMHFYPIILYEHEDTLKTKDIVELFDKTREVLK